MAYAPGPSTSLVDMLNSMGLTPLRVYVFNFVMSEKVVLDMLDTRPEVLNWHRFFPGMVLIVSRSDPVGLHNVFHGVLPDLWFLLAEVDRTKTVGLMNQEVWNFINNPKTSGRWP